MKRVPMTRRETDMVKFRWENHRFDWGPERDEGGTPLHLYWVECLGCGGEYPMIPAKDGRHYPPDWMNRIAPRGEDGRLSGPVFYTSEECTQQAAIFIRQEYDTDEVTVIPHISVPHITLNLDLNHK